MTILFDPATPVKRARPFGRGVLASLPSHRVPYTAADLAWLAAEGDRRADALAGEAEALGRLEAGLCC